MLALWSALALAAPTTRAWEFGAGVTEAGKGLGGRVDVARDLGAVQGRLSLGYTPLNTERYNTEAVVARLSATGAEVRTESQRLSAFVLADWDLGAARLDAGWSGGLRLVGGLGALQLVGTSARWDGDGPTYVATGARWSLRPAVGLGLDLWWNGTIGGRFDLIASRGPGDVLAIEGEDGWAAPPSAVTCLAPAVLSKEVGCNSIVQLAFTVTYAP